MPRKRQPTGHTAASSSLREPSKRVKRSGLTLQTDVQTSQANRYPALASQSDLHVQATQQTALAPQPSLSVQATQQPTLAPQTTPYMQATQQPALVPQPAPHVQATQQPALAPHVQAYQPLAQPPQPPQQFPQPTTHQFREDIGFFNMPTDEEYMYAVKKSFVFLKENIDFEYMEHWLIQYDIITTKEIEDHITQDKAIHFRSERLLKWLIWNRKCKKFVLLVTEMQYDNHIPEEITREINNNLRETQSSLTGAVNSRPHFNVTGDLLQRHFSILYTALEPRNIADFMFQEGHISVEEHDMMTIPPQKHERLKNLLDILKKRKKLYVSFLCTLKFLKFTSVLETLETDKKPENIPSNCILCIQHNFTLLQEELPDPDHATAIMEYVLDKSAISDIEKCSGKIRQKSKLVKKILEGGDYSCMELFRVIEVCLERSDLITTMEIKSAEKLKRGRPGLPPSLSRLNISCLQEYEGILLKELDPLDISDLLFEEEAIEILDHDKITETAIRLEQTKCLIDTVKENRHDCFHFFLFTLQRNDKYNHVCEELEKPTSAAISDESSKQPHWTFSHAILREPVGVPNKNIQLKLSVEGPTGAQKEHVLFQSINSHDTEVRVETIHKGQMIFERADLGSIVIQLRPVTEHAVQTLLKAKENNRLLEMIIGMLENVKMDKLVDDTEQLQIRVQVYYVDSATAKQYTKTSRTTLIKHRVNVHRNALIYELEPKAIVSVLSKSKALTESDIPSIICVENRNCKKEVENLLLMVENGSAEFVEEFVAALKDFGYCDIVELIDPSGFPSTAENFKRNIMSNYKNILSKMNMRFASETLSKCTGDVDLIREKILPGNGNHRQRMNTFVQFILQDDNNVIEFERMLRNYGLEELLKKDESKETQDIEVTIVEDPVPSSSEGVLFESVITFSKIEPPYLEFRGVTTKTGEITIHYIHRSKVPGRSPKVHQMRWTKNGAALEINDKKYFGGGLNDNCITIKTPTLEDQGKYTCTVTNDAGTVSLDIFLDAPKAIITTEPNVSFGSQAMFESVISSYPPPDVVKWEKSRDGLSFHCIDICTPKYDGSRLEPESPKLIICETTFNDGLYYRLLVGNKFGENISNTLHLNIIGSPPNVITSYETEFQNRSVKLIAKVFLYSGMEIPVQDVFWTKNGEKIDVLSREEKYSEVSVEDPSLTIFDVNLHDAGSYQLTAINAVGSTHGDAIILGIPEIIFEKTEGKEGNYLFRATITSIPAPYYAEWQMKKNNDDTFSSLNCNAEEFKGTTNVLPHPILVVKKRNLSDYCFQIKVMNFIGSTTMIIPAYLKLKPFKSSIGDNVRFAVLFDEIAEAFPMIKFNQLKDLISNACKDKDIKTALREAKSVKDCLRILCDNKLFTPSDVIFIQYLLKETDCQDLIEQCIKYAEEQNALCFYEKQPECGYKPVQFHIRGNLSDYNKERIQQIKKNVAAVLGCSTEELHI